MSTPWSRARRSSCSASAFRMARTPPSPRLAQRLGEWPLLLKLVNGALHKRLAAGQPLAAALAWVNAGLDSRGLTVFDARDPVERGDAVAKTLGVSLELFTEDEKARFSELAIFPEDVDVPLAVVETLWSRTAGFDEFETEALCTRLYDQSLLLGLDLATRRIRLHDVIRALPAGRAERAPACAPRRAGRSLPRAVSGRLA